MDSAESSKSNDKLTSRNDSLVIARRAGKTPEACVRRGKAPVTNGNQVFTLGGDGRSPWARRWKDVTAQLVLDLGGREAVSEFQFALCKRAATLTVQLESLEAAMSEGQTVDLDLFGRLVGHLRRVAESLGIQRTPRDSNTLDLASYSQSHYRLAEYAAATKQADAAPVDSPAIPANSPDPPAVDPYWQANTLPTLDESPPAPAADPPSRQESAAASNSTPDKNFAPPPAPPAPSPIPSFQQRLYSGYSPPELRPAPAPQPAPAASVRNIAEVWPPPPEPPRNTNLPSNTPKAEPVASAGTDAPPAPSSEIDGLLPCNRPR
jgi:hypothetical protein